MVLEQLYLLRTFHTELALAYSSYSSLGLVLASLEIATYYLLRLLVRT